MEDDKDSGCEYDSNDVSMEWPSDDFNHVAVNYCYDKSKTKRNLVRRRTVSDSWFDLGSLWTCRSKHDDRDVLSDDEVNSENVVSGETRAKIDDYLDPRRDKKKNNSMHLDVDLEKAAAVGQSGKVDQTAEEADLDKTADTVVVDVESPPEKPKTDYCVDIESDPDYKRVEFYHGSKHARIHVIVKHIFGDDEEDD